MAKTINIQFRLPESYAGELSDYAIGYESQAQTAKRLLMEFLDGKNQTVPVAEITQPRPAAMPDDFGDRLAKLEQHWEWTKREILNAQEKFKEIDHDLYWGESLSFQEIRKDIQRINEAIRKPQPETAIMIQKKPLDPVLAEITLDHIQASKEFEKALTTIKKWSADPNKWPDGWIFDGDKQLWIKTD